MLVKKAKFAEITGISPSGISKACLHGGLQNAVCGSKIDLTSKTAQEYLKKKGIDPDKILSESDTTPKDPKFYAIQRTARIIAIGAKDMIDSGRDIDAIEKFIVDQISSVIRPGKDRVKRAIDNA
jgi:hypothetical protein